MNRTVERAMEILQFVSQKNEGVTIQEIADKLQIPKSSAFVIVKTLLSERYIEPMRYNEKRYKIGIKLYTLGMRYVSEMNIVDLCSMYLNPLADKYHKTAFVGVLEGTSIVYIYKYSGEGVVLAACALGSRKEVHATALGKAILAFSTPEERRAILDSIELLPVTERTITSRPVLEEELSLTRTRGFSRDIKENESVTICCGAPIFDYTGHCIAAISLSDIYTHNIDEDAVAKDLVRAAAQISQGLGANTHLLKSV